MSGNWNSGNAEEDGHELSGWILGHFFDPAEGLLSSNEAEARWGIHLSGDKRLGWTADDHGTAIGKFRIDRTEISVTLGRQGDYLAWVPGIGHS